jgi:hypothetical protein
MEKAERQRGKERELNGLWSSGCGGTGQCLGPSHEADLDNT